MKRLSLLFALLCIASACSAANNNTQNDALAPKTDASSALTTPLKVITISTNSLAESRLFYQDAMGMSMHGPLQVDENIKKDLRKLWGIDAALDWDTYHFYRPNTNNTAAIQLLLFKQQVPAIHHSWSALELGTFSMGFPNLDQIAHDQRVRQVGFGALNVIEIYEVPRPDGSQYPIEETIFNAPDFVHGVGIHRGDGMSQLGEVDANGLGGPAYSALVVKDAQKTIDFLVQVLAWELRSDRQWKSAGTKGALNIPDGTEFRFAIVYSQGASSGHVLLVEYLNVDSIDTGNAPRIPNRGIGMWTVATDDLDQVMQNAKKFSADTISEALLIHDPILGKVRAATLLAPNGLLIKVYEKQ